MAAFVVFAQEKMAPSPLLLTDIIAGIPVDSRVAITANRRIHEASTRYSYCAVHLHTMYRKSRTRGSACGVLDDQVLNAHELGHLIGSYRAQLVVSDYHHGFVAGFDHRAFE